MNSKILRMRDVKERTTLSETTIYRRIAENTFPRQIRLGANSVGWFESDIEDWLAACVSSSEQERQG